MVGLTKVVLAGVLAMSPVIACGMAQGQSAANASLPADAQLATLTVHEAWVQSGRNEDTFFDIVQRLTAMSAQKRGVTLPDDEATGKKMGTLIKTNGRRDPDQLLYAVVDSAVRQVGGASVAKAK